MQDGQAGQPAAEITEAIAAYNLGKNVCIEQQRRERRVLGAIIILINLGLAGIGSGYRAGVYLILAAALIAALRLVTMERLDPYLTPFTIKR